MMTSGSWMRALTVQVSWAILGLTPVVLLAGCGQDREGRGRGGGDAGTCPGDLAEAAGSAFCAASPSATDCAFNYGVDYEQVCGVPVETPTVPLARSSGAAEPDPVCPLPPDGGVKSVTMTGVARMFLHGCQSSDLQIQVYTVGADSKLNPVGSAVLTADDCTMNGGASPSDDCATSSLCSYSYSNVPTETEIAIRTEGSAYAPLVEYSGLIPSAEVMNGVWHHDVVALAFDDYDWIAEQATGAPMTIGDGALVGEVQDCQDVPLRGATVGVNVAPGMLVYFTSDVQAPLPDPSLTSTGDLGRFAALDVPPGEVGVAALGLVGGEVKTVGYSQVRVFPDAFTKVTLHGVPSAP
jgi:hypothetical protein